MIIKSSSANKKIVGPMKISEYKINPDFSGALIEINGDHGKLKCLKEDRIYYIIEGNGKFLVGKEEFDVSGSDLIFVPKGTQYNMKGKLKYFMLCSPEYNSKDDVWLDK